VRPEHHHGILRSTFAANGNPLKFPLGVFDFDFVVVSTIGKVVIHCNDRRALPSIGNSASPGQIDALCDEVGDLGARLHRLEDERDSCKDLLELRGAAVLVAAEWGRRVEQPDLATPRNATPRLPTDCAYGRPRIEI